MIVVGDDSSIGKIRALIQQEAEATPLQQKLETIAKDIGKFGLAAAILTFAVLLLRFIVDRSTLNDWDDGDVWLKIIEYFILAVTVVVLAIPEGLPLAVTLSLAYSVRKMYNDKNLVRRLQACETMGGANNICSDKTGTLTQNKMHIACFWNCKQINVDHNKEAPRLTDTIPHFAEETFLQTMVCNVATHIGSEKGSRTEMAMLEFVQKRGFSLEGIQQKYLPEKPIRFPFSSQRKRMSTVIKVGDKRRLIIKGASEQIVEACDKLYSFEEGEVVPMNEELLGTAKESIKRMAVHALRTLVIAYKDLDGNEGIFHYHCDNKVINIDNIIDLETRDETGVYRIEKSGLTMVAIIGIKDILRPGVKEAVKQCKIAGIKVRMVTGDNMDTARAIAKDCGIIEPNDDFSISMEGPRFMAEIGGVICAKCKTKICDCPKDQVTAERQRKKIREDTLKNMDRFNEIIDHLDVLARSRPEDKYALVTGLKQLGNVVAVTGDGTNDAPALKKADVGFAMGIAGTDVAHDAADIILIDDNFSSIIKAVSWGRNIYDSVRKFLQFQLTVNIVSVVSTLVGSAILKQAIFSAIQLLWVTFSSKTHYF